MADRLWLKAARNVCGERGYTFTGLPRDLALSLTGTFELDPITGLACPPVRLSLAEYFDFTPDPDDGAFVEGMTSYGTAANVHSGTGEWSAITADDALVPNGGFFLWFVPYSGTGPIVVEFGTPTNPWRLVLTRGVGELQWRDDGATFRTVAVEQLWAADTWSTQPHVLYVYAVGSRLCARTIGPDEARGLQATPSWDNWGAGLAGSGVRVSATGYLAWAVAPERHETTLHLQAETTDLPYTATQTPTAEAQTLLPTGVDIDLAVYDQDSNPIDLTASSVEVTGFSWSVDLACDETGPNAYVGQVTIAFPALYASDGVTGVDLAAVAQVAEVTLDEPLSGPARLTAKVRHAGTALSDYAQMNMPLVWQPGGSTRFVGFTLKAPVRAIPVAVEELVLEAHDLFKALETARWGGGAGYAGQPLEDAYADVLARAGFVGSQVHIYAGGYLLPAADPSDQAPPPCQYRGDQSCADVLLDLSRNFGEGDWLRWRGFDFYAEQPVPSPAAGGAWSGITFRRDTDDNFDPRTRERADGMPWVLGDSLNIDSEEEAFANDIWVIGLDSQGNPLVAQATDWTSVNDPSADNYWGGFKSLYVLNADLATQEAVDRLCDDLYDRCTQRVRTLPVSGPWRAALVPGDTVAVDGYEGVWWRVRSMRTTWNGQWPAGRTDYELELLP